MGLDRGDGKRPDGMTLFPFYRGKSLVWDATVADTFCDSHVIGCALGASHAADLAESAKRAKYIDLSQDYDFQPLGFETSGVFGSNARKIIAEIGRRMALQTGDKRELEFLRQRIGLAIVRGNATCVRVSSERFPYSDKLL